MEHKDLRRYKQELIKISSEFNAEDFADSKKKLDTTVNFLTLTLRDHIFKENNILYPAALGVIVKTEDWNELKEKCDKIGYCCFTPEA